MDIVNLTGVSDSCFTAEVNRLSGQDVSRCYQCGTCTAGCPYTFAYDLPVNQIMRLLQAGQEEEVLSSKSIWLCATCETCSTRCPKDIDVAHIMEVLRQTSQKRGYATEPRIKQFYDAFLESVKTHGRVFELGTVIKYMIRSGRVFTDIDLGPKVLTKGKIGFKPHAIQGQDKVAAIFQRYLEQGVSEPVSEACNSESGGSR